MCVCVGMENWNDDDDDDENIFGRKTFDHLVIFFIKSDAIGHENR